MTTGTLARTRRAHRPPADRTGRKGLVGLAVPAIVWYVMFTIGPLVAMFYVSTLSWRGFLDPATFIGLDNYRAVLTDSVFHQSVRNSIVHVGVLLPLMLPTAFMCGYYVSLKPPGSGLLRTLLFTPALISMAAKSMIFIVILAPTGLLNGTLRTVGLGDLAVPWLANSSTALGVIIAVDLWGGIGFTAILFAARLSAISPDIFEAAVLDGAGHWRRMWSIAYPICRSYFGVLTMLQFIWVLFSSAGLVLLLTQGGPGNSSMTVSFLIYSKAFVQNQIGYSQAVGVLLFAAGIAGMVTIRRIFRQNY